MTPGLGVAVAVEVTGEVPDPPSPIGNKVLQDGSTVGSERVDELVLRLRVVCVVLLGRRLGAHT